MSLAAVRRRQKKTTPISDYAHRSPLITRRTGLLANTRFHQTVRRSTMFSLAIRFIKLCGYLFVLLLFLLLTLNFKLVYRGDGTFTVRPKSSWAFAGTFVSEAAPATKQEPAVAPRPRQERPAAQKTGQLEKGLSECNRIRQLLQAAVIRYNDDHRQQPMRELDIFSLLSAGHIEELPNCPAGGEYHLHPAANGTVRISCSRHID